MAQLAVFTAGLLLTTESQASDVAEADPSAVQGFLSKYMTAPTQRAWTSNVKHGNGPDALSHHSNLAEHSPAADDGAGPFMIVDDKPALHPAPQMQDSFAFTPAKDLMDAHLTEHTMIEMAISSMAVVHKVHVIVPCPNM